MALLELICSSTTIRYMYTCGDGIKWMAPPSKEIIKLKERKRERDKYISDTYIISMAPNHFLSKKFEI